MEFMEQVRDDERWVVIKFRYGTILRYFIAISFWYSIYFIVFFSSIVGSFSNFCNCLSHLKNVDKIKATKWTCMCIIAVVILTFLSFLCCGSLYSSSSSFFCRTWLPWNWYIRFTSQHLCNNMNLIHLGCSIDRPIDRNIVSMLCPFIV